MSPYRNEAWQGTMFIWYISVIFNFVTTTNMQFNSSQKTIYSGNYCFGRTTASGEHCIHIGSRLTFLYFYMYLLYIQVYVNCLFTGI